MNDIQEKNYTILNLKKIQIYKITYKIYYNLNLIRQYDATYRIFFQLQISKLPSENTLPN